MQEYQNIENENKTINITNQLNSEFDKTEEKDINDKNKQNIKIAKIQNKQRLCISFTPEEMKKIEIAYNYKFNMLKHSQISNSIKNKIMKEVNEILDDMKQNFFN